MTDMALMTRAERATHINNLRSMVTLDDLQIAGLQVVLTTPERWSELLEKEHGEEEGAP